MDNTEAEACATQDVHKLQIDSTQQADIAEQICRALVRYPGYSQGPPPRCDKSAWICRAPRGSEGT
jgi:hypothetical protein